MEIKRKTLVLILSSFALGVTQCKTRDPAPKSSELRSDWSPDSEWESLGNGKKRRKWVMEWQCALRESDGGKRQDEYCEWNRKKTDASGNLFCEFNANFFKNRKYYIPMRYDPDMAMEERDFFWEHTQFNTYRDLLGLVRQCSVKNAHCDKDKVAATLDTVPQCQNVPSETQYECLKNNYSRCHKDCYAAVPYLAKKCVNNTSAECKALEVTDSKPNEIKNCRTINPNGPAAEVCIKKITATCEKPCRVACDEFRSSDPQICADIQRVLYDEGGEIQPIEHEVISDVKDNNVLLEKKLLIQLQATSPEALPEGCIYDVDPTLKTKLATAGWDQSKMSAYARQEKTYIACNLNSAQTAAKAVKSCDDIAVQLRAGTQAWIVVEE
jgi:hypothetical protein